MNVGTNYRKFVAIIMLTLLALTTNVSAQRYREALTGTWRLNPGRSDNPEEIINREARGIIGNDNQQPRRNVLLRRLTSPDTLAIERTGRRVTLASTLAPQVSFDADGRSRTEYNQRGRATRTTVSLAGNRLTVNTTGDRGNDYFVAFEPLGNGRQMRVTRRIYTEQLTNPITVTSVYDKTSDYAQWNIYEGRDLSRDNRDTWNDRNDRGPTGSFYVPNGVQLTTVLNERLHSRDARTGDRFTLTVRGPGQYDGALIEGVIREADRAGRFSGRAEMAFDFERIRLRNGVTHEFAGYIESVRTPNGDTIRVDNEGSVKESDGQTERTVTRTGIGAALGAIIGAIAGGGKGAAIGAAVGAGAGAGSVFITGRDDLELPAGTEMTIRSSSPKGLEARRP